MNMCFRFEGFNSNELFDKNEKLGTGCIIKIPINDVQSMNLNEIQVIKQVINTQFGDVRLFSIKDDVLFFEVSFMDMDYMHIISDLGVEWWNQYYRLQEILKENKISIKMEMELVVTNTGNLLADYYGE